MSEVKTIDIHGKPYVPVNERIKLLHDSGAENVILNTEIIHDDEKSVCMKTTVEIDGNMFSGFAQEFKGSSNINKTSAYENCETSSVGRALGFAGFGACDSIASYEEVANAIMNTEPEKPSKKQLTWIPNLCAQKGESVPENLEQFTKEEATALIDKLLKMGDK